MCIRSQRDGFQKFTCPGIEKAGTCRTGHVPDPLTRENRRVFGFYTKVQAFLFNGMGGADLSAVSAAFDIHRVPPGQRPVIMDRLSIIIQSIRENREKDKK